MRPTDLPFTEHFQKLPCGTRAKYVGGGCRCLLCRAANSRYATGRAAAKKRGEWNGLVPAGPARRHLFALSRAGVGRRSVQLACDVTDTVLAEVKSGRKGQIRAETERRILAVTVDAKGGAALVPAGRTWRRINQLLEEGFTKAEIARRLGRKTPALQIRKRHITLRTAVNVERLFETVMR